MISIKCPDPELVPVVGTEQSAGMDLKTAVDFCLNLGAEITVGTGVYVELPRYTVGLCVPRSSLGKHEGLYVVFKNTVGVIDSDYRGEIMVKLRNLGSKPLVMYKGDRICQMVVVPHLPPNFVVVDELSKTTRGTGGFGHTGDDIKTS